MRKAILEMVRQSEDAADTRRRIAFLENHVEELEKALRRATDDNVALAKRVRELESTVDRLKLELSED